MLPFSQVPLAAQALASTDLTLVSQVISGTAKTGRITLSTLAGLIGSGAVGTNGQAVTFGQLTELTTIAAAATTTTAIQIPATALVFAVSTRVTVVIPTAATYSIGVSGTAGRYAAGVSTAANTTNNGSLDAMRYYAAATGILITPNATPGNNSGRMRVTIHYILVTPPTS